MDNKHKWQDIIFQRGHVSGLGFRNELYSLYQALNLVNRRPVHSLCSLNYFKRQASMLLQQCVSNF